MVSILEGTPVGGAIRKASSVLDSANYYARYLNLTPEQVALFIVHAPYLTARIYSTDETDRYIGSLDQEKYFNEISRKLGIEVKAEHLESLSDLISVQGEKEFISNYHDSIPTLNRKIDLDTLPHRGSKGLLDILSNTEFYDSFLWDIRLSKLEELSPYKIDNNDLPDPPAINGWFPAINYDLISASYSSDSDFKLLNFYSHPLVKLTALPSTIKVTVLEDDKLFLKKWIYSYINYCYQNELIMPTLDTAYVLKLLTFNTVGDVTFEKDYIVVLSDYSDSMSGMDAPSIEESEYELTFKILGELNNNPFSNITT